MKRILHAAVAGLMFAALSGSGTAVAQQAEKATSQKKLNDAAVIGIFEYANARDVETAGLAAQRSESDGVKELARTFVQDHRNLRQQVRGLAEKVDITPTRPTDDEAKMTHAKVMETLRSKSGSAFDAAWLDHEIAYHEMVIRTLTEQLLPAIQNAELKAFVEKAAPAFRSHLASAKELKAKVVSD